MPLGNSVTKNIEELMRDNKRRELARGANGKKRSHQQIVAIALNAARRADKKIKRVRRKV